MRSSGPLGTSRMPGRLDDDRAGLPSAKRAYQSSTSAVTKPSSVARQGTIAGTQVRWRRERLPASRGENRRERAASSMVGIGLAPARSGCVEEYATYCLTPP